MSAFYLSRANRQMGFQRPLVVIKEIHKTRLSAIYKRISLHNVCYIGIDEFSIKKGHKYMTIFVDLSTGRILHVVEGISKESIYPFLKKVSKKAKKLKAVAMDMSRSYFSSLTMILWIM
jgi:transposase